MGSLVYLLSMNDAGRSRQSVAMKPLIGVLAFALADTAFSARAAEPVMRLVGIVTVTNQPMALLEKESASPLHVEFMLVPGQRDDGIEVLEIDSAAGKVKLEVEGKTQEIAFAAAPRSGLASPASQLGLAGQLNQRAGIRLQGAGLRQVFALYQQLAERSFIRPTALPDIRLDLGSQEQVTVTDILQGIEQALREKGITLKPDGDKFVIATKVGDPDRITPEVREAAAKLAATTREPAPAQQGSNTEPQHSPDAPNPNTSATQEPVLPAGTINFPGTDLDQVLPIFQELANRTLLRPLILPATPIDFRTYTPTTKVEAIYAFTAFLALNGVSVLPVGDHFIFVCPTTDLGTAVRLLEQRPLPVPLASEERVPPGTTSGSPFMDLKQFLTIYQELTGKGVEVDADTNLTRRLALPRAQTSLTRAEVVYALDLLLAWDGLEVLPQAEGRAKLTRIKKSDRR
jgi:hypothetical protein